MNNRQYTTPLFSKLKEHARKKPIQFHVPGHKTGTGMDPEFRQFIGYNTLSIDLTNIGPLDDLHHPTHIIREAQCIAAEAFGADSTLFSVQGTSGAIMAMIISVCSPGEKIIDPRNAHKSVFNAIILAGAYPIFVHPKMDSKLGIAHGVPTSEIKRALKKYPETRAVLVIHPTYFGVVGNLKELVSYVHQKHIPVLVDEAHGILNYFHERLPISAMDAGADMAATSVHKLGGSLSQSSVLNIRGNLVDSNRVQSIMSMLTTTSTSYLLLSSLDTARRYLATKGHELIENTLELAIHARKQINKIPGLHCLGRDSLTSDALYEMDETKLVIHLESLKINGFETEKWLRKHYNIEVELSDLYNILCLITLGDTKETVSLLINALKDLSNHFYTNKQENSLEIFLPEIPTLELSPREAYYSDIVSVPLTQSKGEISAEFIMIYPPGIPVLIPGERITQRNIDYIQEHLLAGLSVQGTVDPSIRQIRIVKS